MEFEFAQSNTTAKLPILKLGEYKMWVIRIMLYFQMSVPVTAEENTNKKNDVKARSLLLMALPNEHQLTFSQYSDAKTMFAAIKTRFGGNEATKKTQKTIRLAVLGVVISQEDLNSKFLRSLPPEWNTHVVVWMNKADIKIMSIYDLYNNFKIIEQDVKKSVGASSGAQNLAFLTTPSTSSTNDINTANLAFEVSTVSPNINTTCLQVSTANFSDNIVYAFMVENPNGSNLLQYDKSKVKCFNYHKMGHFTRECRAPRNKESQFKYQDNTRKQGNNEDTSSNAMLAIDGVGFDRSGMAEEQKQYDDLIIKLNQIEFIAATYKRGLATVEEQLITYKMNEVLFSKEVAVLKSLDKLLGSRITNKSKKGLGYNVVPPPHPLIYNRPKKLDLSYSGLDEFKDTEFKSYGSENSKQEFNIINYNYHQRERMVSRNNYNRVDYDYYAKTIHPSAHRNMTPRAVLLKISITPLHTIRPVNTAYPKPAVHSAKSMSRFSKQAQSTYQRPFYKKTSLTSRYVNQKLNIDIRHYHTKRPRAVNTARSCTTQVNVVREKRVNDVKTSACWVWRPTRPNGASLGKPQQDDTRFIDIRCSRHMTKNIAYLSDFKEFIGGYVTFGGGAHGGRISSKGTLKTNSLDFEDLYFVNELNFNLFSVSQMCDKKNYVLFTDTKCLVVSPNFKFLDESQILLKIPRKDNMYSFDMKNIVPKESLTCLVAKATSDELMLWHRRLGQIDFKNINKLVKDNLVRGLPTKRFENDQTYIACLKGKQHRAFCKSKVLNPITKPLFMLHMDLFGPTFVSSLMHKKYCLVVTDDYSRFTWVFFLTTKDETSKILKNFIKEIENLVDKKVKIIRSDNGTEFKNKVMDDFCKEKCDSKLPTIFWAEAISIACYVQNRVLVVKLHNKTPYELFRGLKPALSFMRPFGCHVTILNTLDNLGKFDGQSDEGFFVRYSLGSKAFRVYNTRTMRVEENLHIRFLKNKPMIERNGPKWLFDIDSLTQSMNYVPVVTGTILNESTGIQGELNAGTSTQKKEISQDCIVMPIWKDASYFDSPSKDVDKSKDDSSPKEVNDVGQHVNTASSEANTGRFKLNTIDPSVNTASSSDQDSPKDMLKFGASGTLEATHVEFFSDEDEPEVDLGNITNSYTVLTIPNTRIHKDHPIKNVIGDVKSSIQTRRMTKSTSEQGFLSVVYEQKTHDTLNTCLYACFLSQIEPTSIAKALSDSSWVEAMQEELLQFKL
ncbi:putative ribonuclease H-like domain-containing protein [Tanacetum coccineum]